MTKVLVVDDSPTEIYKVKGMLEGLGYEVITAKNGRDGVEMAGLEQPDCVLMDIVMPDMNGFQATRAITSAEATKHIPVIMLSTKDQETDMLWATRQGASDYVVKPPNEKELLSKIDGLLK